MVQTNDSFNHYDNQHFLLLSYNKRSRDANIIDYINHGLNKNELCIYGTISLRDKNSLKFASQIVDYEKNIKENNLIVIDMAPFYIEALTEDLRLFEEMKKEIIENIKNRVNERIRIVYDCASFLFENKHFTQCLSLESWCHQRTFKGTYLCPYPNSILDHYPYNLHKDNIIEKHHDIVINAESILYEEFIVTKTIENTNKVCNEKKEVIS